MFDLTGVTSEAGRFGARLVLIAVLALVFAITVGGFLTNPFGWKDKVAQAWRGKAEQAQGEAAVNAGQAEAALGALDIIFKGGAADAATGKVQSENQNAIMAAPGAEGRLSPDLAAAFVRGVCRYQSVDGDPVCDQLRAAD